eukprot:gene8757-11831_t
MESRVFEVDLEKKTRGNWPTRTYRLKGQLLECYDKSSLRGAIDIGGCTCSSIDAEDAEGRQFSFMLMTEDEEMVLNALNNVWREKCIKIFTLAGLNPDWVSELDSYNEHPHQSLDADGDVIGAVNLNNITTSIDDVIGTLNLNDITATSLAVDLNYDHTNSNLNTSSKETEASQDTQQQEQNGQTQQNLNVVIGSPKQTQPVILQTQCFLSHNWGDDVDGRDNHARVRRINEGLKNRGFITWFDEEQMVGDLRKRMTEGIENTLCVIAFITSKYREKVNGKDERDNCKCEFSHAVHQRGPQNMIAVVMEEGMKNNREWKSELGVALQNKLYIDSSSDDNFDTQIDGISRALNDLQIFPSLNNSRTTSNVDRFEIGSWVWICDEEERYLPGKVLEAFTKGEPTTVQTEDHVCRVLTVAETICIDPCNTEALDSNLQDLVNISELNEMSVLHMLRIRFKEDRIYTNISSLLIAVNPFKMLPLYTPEVLEMYRTGSHGKPPHIYAIAHAAYDNMLMESKDQTVVITGESGAGKTESMKLILQYLVDSSAQKNSSIEHTSALYSLETKIMASNPILEAFGNAKTLLNNNSSRFGKMVFLNFDARGSITGARIMTYMLENSRVAFQTTGERNFHIFYQLLTASETDYELATSLKLKSTDLYLYTHQSGMTIAEGKSDEKDFEELQNSMQMVGISTEMMFEIFKIIAGVMHFGNMNFKFKKLANGEDSCAIINEEVLSDVSCLWGCDSSQLEKVLTNHQFGVDDKILVANSTNQAKDVRDVMVKLVYSQLFLYLVDKINMELSSSGMAVSVHKFIGVLDIFGFENFELNSFEQFYINFCNEKLHLQVVDHFFRKEQQLYFEEDLHNIRHIDFIHFQPTIDLLESSDAGIFNLIDDETRIANGSDEGCLQKILSKHGDGQHPNCLRAEPKNVKDFINSFGIVHYAGTVFYNIKSFLEKNMGDLHEDVVELLRTSENTIIHDIFSVKLNKSNKIINLSDVDSTTDVKKTLGYQFRTDMDELMKTLNSTFSHFVFCMKSNPRYSANVFNSQMMQDQIRYVGLVELCNIRKLGYPIRYTFKEFFQRYHPIDSLSQDLDDLLNNLSSKELLKEGEWMKGRTKVFMRTVQSIELEFCRAQSLIMVVTLLQKHGRRMNAVTKYKYFKKIIQDLHEAVAKREEEGLDIAIKMLFELPYNGRNLQILNIAKAVLVRVKDENRVAQLLESAINSRDLNSLKHAIVSYTQVDPTFESVSIGKAEILLARLEEEMQLKSLLKEAISTRTRENVEKLVDKAQIINFECDELVQAITLMKRLDQETALLSKLQDAVNNANYTNLSQIVTECVSQGLDTSYAVEIAKAKEVLNALFDKEVISGERSQMNKREDEEEKHREELIATEAARNNRIALVKDILLIATTSKDITALNAALQEAIQNGVQIAEVETARKVLDELKNLEQAKSEMEIAIKVLQLKIESGITEYDLIPYSDAISRMEKISELSNEASENLLEAKEMLITFQKHVKAKIDLEDSLASKDKFKLRTALDSAEDLDMQIDVANRAREMLKEINSVKNHINVTATDAHSRQVNYGVEENRKCRQELAKQARFDFKNFSNLRSADDFARGAILNKSKIMDQFLTFQPNVIPKSLTELDKDHNTLALQIHKDLLGYMGDKMLAFPTMLAQDILRIGHEHKPLRDEIYLQIIKQLINCPRPSSVAKGWQMMCMCVGTFPPSQQFENFLLHFIIEKRDIGRGAVVDYARYCLVILERMLNSHDRIGSVPSVEEITAYKERPPILATIYLVDGNILTEDDLPLAPDINVGIVLKMCVELLDLKDPRINTLGMFVYDLGLIKNSEDPHAKAPHADLKRTPRPLRNTDFMGDMIIQKVRQKRKFRFVLKRKIFLPKHNYRGDDTLFERMTYLQAEDEAIIQGNIEINDVDEATHLAAISVAVAYGEEMPVTVDEMVEGSVIDFIPLHWRETRSPQAWAEMILSYRESLIYVEPDDLQDQFLKIVQRSSTYGSHWFYVHKLEPKSYDGIPLAIQQLPYDLLIALNYEGMHIYTLSRQLLMSLPYSDICRWDGDSSQFIIIANNDQTKQTYEFLMITSQAADMASIILDIISAIKTEQESEDA